MPKVVISTICALILIRCSSGEVRHDAVLTPTEKVGESVSAEGGSQYQTLITLLGAKGVEGVGLEFDSESSHNLMIQVFSQPEIEKRRIRLLYSGQAMAYEPKTEALTIGGVFDLPSVLKYIQKNIPLKPY